MDPQDKLAHVPAWVPGVGLPVWITDPWGKLRFMNARAEELLGREAATCLGRPCHQVVAGLDAAGKPHCRRGCALLTRARTRGEIGSTLLQIVRPDGERRWVDVVVVSVTAPDGTRPWLVHLAPAGDRAHRAATYLSRVASRALATDGAPGSALTKRELEILRRLAVLGTSRNVAAELRISYATVRNHVQHILAKLEVHSIEEAVAWYVLTAE